MNKEVIFVFVLSILVAISAQESSSEKVSYKLHLAPSVCKNPLVITDSNGFFEKTVCYIPQNDNPAPTYGNASKFCKEQGMKLYKFDSATSYDGWLKLANSMWTRNGASVWVNGQRDDNQDEFKILDSDKSHSIVENVNFRDLQSDGKCLRMKKFSQGQFSATPFNCNGTMTFFCEFRPNEITFN